MDVGGLTLNKGEKMFEELLGTYIVVVTAIMVTLMCGLIAKMLWDEWR